MKAWHTTDFEQKKFLNQGKKHEKIDHHMSHICKAPKRTIYTFIHESRWSKSNITQVLLTNVENLQDVLTTGKIYSAMQSMNTKTV